MSMRLLVRAAVVGALIDKTLAGKRVFDTLYGHPQQSQDNALIPSIAVYTDNDRRVLRERGTVGGGYDRSIDLGLDLTFAAWRTSPVEDRDDEGAMIEAGVPQLGIVQTDAELEATMDLFELQAYRALYAATAAGNRLHQFILGIEEFHSVPGRDGKGNNKLAARTLQFSIRIRDDCRPSGTGENNSVYPDIATVAPYLAPMLATLNSTPGLESLHTLLQELYGTAVLPPVNHVNTLHFVAGINTLDPDRTDLQVTFPDPIPEA